jgi:pimeloyl-ACP methyl ester carboxylesterase
MTKAHLHIIRICCTIILFSSCKKEPFTQKGIAEDHFFLKSGNQHMPVTVGGNVDAKKLLVIIHGGPGGNAITYRDKYVKETVEKEFAIVYWDQRFAGNTQGNGGQTHISDFRKDIKHLLLLLKAKYGQDFDIYLFGHSWGGFLTPYFLVEADHQQLVKGWIQIGGAHNYRLNDSLTRDMLLFYGNQEINSGNNTSTWEEIVEWCSNNSFEGRKNAATLNGFAHRAEGLMNNVNNPEVDIQFKDIKSYALFSQLTNMAASGLIRKIDEPTYVTPISDQLNRITLPTLLLWGKYDFVCPPGLADDIELHIGSSNVTKIIYPFSGHSPMYNEYVTFWSDVITWVKNH